MEEIGPVLAGAVFAWLASFVSTPWQRRAALLIFCVAFGLAWSEFAGELGRHWGYAVLDAAQVALSYAVIRWAASRYRLRRQGRRIG
jgi:hypothetical protein